MLCSPAATQSQRLFYLPVLGSWSLFPSWASIVCVTLGKTLSFSGSLLLTRKTRAWALINPKALSNSDLPNDIPFVVTAEGEKRGHHILLPLAWVSPPTAAPRYSLTTLLFLVLFPWSLGSPSCDSHPPLLEFVNQATLTPSTKCI